MLGLSVLVSINDFNNHKEHDGEVTERVYAGKIHFTEVQYSKFKDFIASHSVFFNKKEVILNSPDPLIDFEMTVYGDYESPYGYLQSTKYVNWGEYWGVLTLASALFVGAYLVLSGYCVDISRWFNNNVV